MNYKTALEDLLKLKSFSQTFNCADKRLVDVLKEKVELEKEIEKNNKSIFLKIFQNSLYQERKFHRIVMHLGSGLIQ